MKILLISCGGTIVSPPEEPGVKSAIVAPEPVVEKLINEITPPPMIEFLNSRAMKKRSEFISANAVDNGCYRDLMIHPPQSGHGKSKGSGSAIDWVVIFDMDSTEVGPLVWENIINCIIDNYDKYDGFIVTHGTNTLAYTASALTFGLPKIHKPVVITGSNNPFGLPFSDAIVNASNAVLLTHTLISEGERGVMVVFASRIMPGTRTKKASGRELEAFRTFNASDIGQMRPKEPVISNDELRKYQANLIEGSPWFGQPLVSNARELKINAHTRFEGIISSHTFHPGDDPCTYIAVLDIIHKKRLSTGIRGALIIRAVGDGDVSKAIQENVYQTAKDLEIPIVVTTQEPGGTSSLKSNDQSEGVEGKYGVIPAWDMSIETMVVKLRYLLSQRDYSYSNVKEKFIQNFHGEIRNR
jgi:L-asparaginase